MCARARRNPSLPRGVARAVTCAVLAVAVALSLVSPVGSVTQSFPDPRGGPTGPHEIVRVVVDNTGPRVTVTVWHRGRRWSGEIRLRLDTGGRPGAEHVVTLRHARRPAPTFRDADGTRWRCRDRAAFSRPGQRFTRLSFPRSCAAGRAAKLRVHTRVEAPRRRTDFHTTRVVPQVATPPASRQTRPNVLLITVDDMRKDDLWSMPRTRQWLGAGGSTWENALSPNPLCCPARASILTGQYTHNHDVYSHREPYGFRSFDDRSTLATWLDAAGYRTAFLGKYLNGYGTQPAPGQTTGDSMYYYPPGWDDWRAAPDGGGVYRYYGTTLTQNQGRGIASLEGRYQSFAYGDVASDMVRRHATSEIPFFSFLSFTAPHHGQPFEEGDDPEPVTRQDADGNTVTTQIQTPAVPPATRGMFDSVRSAPGAAWRDPDTRDMPRELRDVPPPNAAELAAMAEAHRQRLESLRATDMAIDQIMRTLQDTGELGLTYVLFTSDNGYFLGEHGIRQGKVYPYDAALRVPLLIRGPGIPAGQVRSDPFLSVDIAPTILQMAGAPVPAGVDGVGLLPVARGGDQGWTRPVLVNTGPGSTVRETDESGVPLEPEDTSVYRDQRFLIGIRTSRYLYTDRADGFEELYDLRSDPDAYENLVVNNDLDPDGVDGPNVAEPGHHAVLETMRSLLARMRACRSDGCRAGLPDELRTGP